MPTYEYECPRCGHEFERFQGINDPPVKTCPECRSRRVKRKIGTGGGIIFKGSGFYATDYRSDSYKKAAKSEGKPAEASGSDAGKGGSKESKEPTEKTKPAKPETKTAKKPAGDA